jgi:ABC-type glycerol-3-phosphate transport system permease component
MTTAISSVRVKKGKRISVPEIIVGCIIFLISLASILPFLYVISLSFTDPSAYVPFKVSFIPAKVSLDSYRFAAPLETCADLSHRY